MRRTSSRRASSTRSASQSLRRESRPPHLAQSHRRQLRARPSAGAAPPSRRLSATTVVRDHRYRRIRFSRSRTPGRERGLAPAGGGGDGRDEPARARDVRAAALRRTIDRRNRRGGRHREQRGQAAHLPRRAEAAPGARRAGGQPVNHLTDDELVLHYYDEDGADLVKVERHLETCVDCAGRTKGWRGRSAP